MATDFTCPVIFKNCYRRNIPITEMDVRDVLPTCQDRYVKVSCNHLRSHDINSSDSVITNFEK